MIERNKELLSKAFDYIGILNPVVDQVKSDQKIRRQIEECLTLDPDLIDTLSIKQIDKYLILIPKALIWIQECENLAKINLDDAEDAYEDDIETPAALLDKTLFNCSQVTEKMRLARIKKDFPEIFEQRVKELRTRKAIFTRLSGQTKHLERLNDNFKKIREALVIKMKIGAGHDQDPD